MAVSKFIHLASVKVTPISTITELNKIHKEFIWNHERPKIKEETVINNFERGDLKDVDILSKITSLQCSIFINGKLLKSVSEKFQISWIP